MKILLLAAALFSALSAAPASPGEKTDLQELFRSLDRVIARSGDRLARRVLSDHEWSIWEQHQQPVRFLAIIM